MTVVWGLILAFGLLIIFWDDPDLEAVATWQAAIERLKVDRSSLFTDDDVAAFAQQLMELRPASSRQAARP